MSRRSSTPALITVCLVLFLTFLDTTIVSVTLGSVQSDLGAGVISLQWVVNAYALVFACLMLVAGSLADRLGRKPIMLAGIAVFCVGSVVCATAPNVDVLIAGRAIMGVGAAASEPGTLSIIRHLYPDARQRARALGVWTAVSGLALALGPVVGGLLVGVGDWRTVFWFNLALSLVLLVATARYVPNSADPRAEPIDVRGFVLGSAALAVAVYAVIAGETHGYGSWWILALFVVAVAALAAFVVVERHTPGPMLNLRYVTRPMVAAALFVAFAVYFGVFSIFFFTALYLNGIIGYSGWRMAGVFSPMAVAIVLGAVLTGRWVAAVGPKVPMISGCVLSAVGMMLARTQLTAHPSFWPLALALAVAGLGFGVAVVPLTSAVLSHVPPEDSGMAASATNTSRQIGAVVGVAALGALVNSHLTSDLTHRLTQLGIPGALQSFIVSAVESGGGSGGGIDLSKVPPSFQPIVDAAIDAFLAGLRECLIVSAVLVLVAAVITALVPAAAARASTAD
jgi:EmrB/QacA subfamily drug resistance transporter